MPVLETRYPCPVCLGVKLEKVILETDVTAAPRARRTAGELILDHCARCGGVWFEAGEVQRLRRCDAALLWREIVQREGVHSMQCHSCGAHLARTEASCHVCGWNVALDCPVCARPMRVAEQNGMRLDYCTHCRGVWFDHDELTGIWRMEVDALVERRGARALDTVENVMLLDVLLYDPFVMMYGVHAAGHVAGAAAEGLAHAPEAIAEAADAAGEVASSLFETIVDIIGGIVG